MAAGCWERAPHPLHLLDGADVRAYTGRMPFRLLSRRRRRPTRRAVHGIDRFITDVRHGRFERALSAVTAVGAIVTTLEIFFEHDKASFGKPWMWAPIVISPLGAVAGLGGVVSHRLAKTALPIASVVIIANGLQGTFLHAQGISQKPGGWRNFRYNVEMGPPIMAPLLVTMVGGMGLLAAILRREP
jgi:hypothetical protein